MTPVEQALADGFSALQGVAARECLFRDQSVLAVIDETGGRYDLRRRSGVDDLDIKVGAIIEIAVPDCDSSPRPGETLTEDSGRRYRFSAVERVGNVWRITAEPSRAAS